LKIAAVGNPNSLLGLSLAGIKKIYETSSPEKALSFIDQLITSGGYGLVIITSDLYPELRSELMVRRKRHRLPLFVEFKPRGLDFEREQL